jgi:hypothetical protein
MGKPPATANNIGGAARGGGSPAGLRAGRCEADLPVFSPLGGKDQQGRPGIPEHRL